MRRLAIVRAVCTSFVLGATLLAAAHDEHRDQSAIPQDRQQNRQDQARPADQQNSDRQNQDRQNQEQQNQQRQNENKPAENRPGQTQQTQEEQNRDRQQGQTNLERQNREPQDPPRHAEMPPNDNRQNQGHDVNPGGRQEQAQPEDQARQGHPEGNGRRIPESDFRAHFGREHRFAPGRIESYEGRPRFFYSGYTFELLGPWPSDWAYDQDDCYVDYVDDGYWLYNDRDPGDRVPVMIVE